MACRLSVSSDIAAAIQEAFEILGSSGVTTGSMPPPAPKSRYRRGSALILPCIAAFFRSQTKQGQNVGGDCYLASISNVWG